MKKLVTALSAAALVAILLPASAYAGERHRDRTVTQHRYERVYAAEPAYAQRPVYAAAGLPADPLLYPVGGAIIGAIIGAAVCPPCAIAGSALTSGSGALVGAGIGAIGGTVVGVAATQPRIVRY
jgi:hypothetical protein